MDSEVYIQLIFLCVVNLILAFSGVVSNTLAIASFLKSSQLRKKVSNLMIMVLSCVDFVAVVTIHPVFALYMVFWSTEDYDLLHKMKSYAHFATFFLGFSFLALLVMSIERYLAMYYPIFHRNSVTKRRLLKLLAVLFILYFTILMIIYANDWVISITVFTIVFMAIVFPPIVFINYKLYKISRNIRRIKATSPEKRTTINLKNIHTCLLAVACLLILSIPTTFYVAFSFAETQKSMTTNVRLCFVWAASVCAMNSTCNSLIFFWKNKVLRTEGIKILKTLKDRIFRS